MTDAELVKAAAEKVMGWEACYRKRWGSSYPFGKSFPYLVVFESGQTVLRMSAKDDHTDETWNPLTSDTDCWQLVDKLTASTYSFNLSIHGMITHAGFHCPYGPCPEHGNEDTSKGHGAMAYEPCRRRAIVLAALMAYGVDVDVDLAMKGAR